MKKKKKKKKAVGSKRYSLRSHPLGSENTTYISSASGSKHSAVLNKLKHSRCLQSGLLSSAMIVETSYRLPRAAQRTFCSANAVVLKTEVSELG
jgi:hypothetical protein